MSRHIDLIASAIAHRLNTRGGKRKDPGRERKAADRLRGRPSHDGDACGQRDCRGAARVRHRGPARLGRSPA